MFVAALMASGCVTTHAMMSEGSKFRVAIVDATDEWETINDTSSDIILSDDRLTLHNKRSNHIVEINVISTGIGTADDVCHVFWLGASNQAKKDGIKATPPRSMNMIEGACGYRLIGPHAIGDMIFFTRHSKVFFVQVFRPTTDSFDPETTRLIKSIKE